MPWQDITSSRQKLNSSLELIDNPESDRGVAEMAEGKAAPGGGGPGRRPRAGWTRGCRSRDIAL